MRERQLHSSGGGLTCRTGTRKQGYVRHCFQEKTQTTSKQDKEIATARYRAVVNARKGKR